MLKYEHKVSGRTLTMINKMGKLDEVWAFGESVSPPIYAQLMTKIC